YCLRAAGLTYVRHTERQHRPGNVHLADALVALVRNIQVSCAVHGYSSRLVEFCGGSRSAVAGEAGNSVSGHRADIPTGVHLADALIALVRNVQVSCAVYRHPSIADTRHGTDVSARVHLADALIALVRNVQVSCAVHRHPNRLVQLRGGSCSAVASETGSSVPRHGADIPAGVHLTDALIVLVRNVQVSCAVYRHPSIADTRHGTDVSARVHLADALIALVRNVQVSCAVHRHPNRLVQLRGGSCSAVASETGSSVPRHGADIPAGVHLTDALIALVRNV